MKTLSNVDTCMFQVFRMPTYEIAPLEQVAGKCVVMDLSTYCKGKPLGVKPQDIYICEYRVDKTAHLFYKIVKHRYCIVEDFNFFTSLNGKRVCKETV